MGGGHVPETQCRKRAWSYTVKPDDDGDPFTVRVAGREAWALDRLREAGELGCTPMESPAPRWSSYINRLRARGVPIETVAERHGGEFAGTHARYCLRATVREGGDE